MAKLYDKSSILDFYRRRFNRLFPAYALTILLTTSIGYFLLVPVDYGQLRDQVVAASLFNSNIFYWNQNSYFDKSAFNPLLNLWSLGVEAQFYLITPFLFAFVRRSKVVFFSVFLLSLIACLMIQMVSPKTSFFWMPLRIWEFLIGAWIAWNGVSSIESSSLKTQILRTVPISLLILTPIFLRIHPQSTGSLLFGHPAIPALTITVITGLVLRFGIPIGILKSYPGNTLCRIGDWSYSIYLVHFPTIVFFNYKPFGGTQLTIEDELQFILAVLSFATLSLFFYRYVEKRYSNFFNQLISSVFLWSIIPITALIFGVLNLNKYSYSDINIFGAWTDRDTYRCGKLFRVLNPKDLICPLTTSGTANDLNQKVLLVGDSHADSIKSVFANTVAKYGIQTYFTVSNNPLMGGPDSDKLIAVALRNKIDVIVIHYSNIYKYQIITQELVKFVELANANKIKTFLIGPVPSYEVHIPEAMFEDKEKLFKFKKTFDQHNTKTEEYLRFAKHLEGLGVTRFEPADFLCPSRGVCLISTSTMRPYYFDSGHLTLSGAYVLKPLFIELFQTARN